MSEHENEQIIEAAAERPEWLPENFKTPEDLAKSYDESRREMDRLRSERDEERAQFAAALERIETAQQQQVPAQFEAAQNPLLAQYQQAVDAGDAAAQLAISIALNRQIMAEEMDTRFATLKPQLDGQAKADRDVAFTLAENTVMQEYGDQWSAIAPDVNAWLKEHAAWLPAENTPQAFAHVIREGARTVSALKAAERLASLEQDRAAKLSAATATGSGMGKFPTATDDKKQAWNEIKSAPSGSYSDIARG